MVMIGITLILAGGLYTLYRENVQSIDVITSSPMPVTAAIAEPADASPRDVDAKVPKQKD